MPGSIQRFNEGLGKGMNLFQAIQDAQRRHKADESAAAAAAPTSLEGVPFQIRQDQKLPTWLALQQSRSKAQKPLDLSGEQEKRIMDASASAKGLANVGRSFQEKGLGEFRGEGIARTLKSLPLVGQGGMMSGPLDALMPKSTQYMNQQRQQVESDLRAATGATAPPEEVKTYLAFMPQIGDDPSLAASKLKDYQNKIMNKAMSVADSLDVQGRSQEAAMMRERIKGLFAQSGLEEVIQGMEPGQDQDSEYREYMMLKAKRGQ